MKQRARNKTAQKNMKQRAKNKTNMCTNEHKTNMCTKRTRNEDVHKTNMICTK